MIEQNLLFSFGKIKIEFFFLDKTKYFSLYQDFLQFIQKSFSSVPADLSPFFHDQPQTTVKLEITETTTTEDNFDFRFFVAKYIDKSTISKLNELSETVKT